MLKNSISHFIKAFFISVLFTLSANFVFAATYIKGSSNFSSAEGDSLVFIKSQLLSKAIENIIDKELKSMGHDNQLFWQTYNQKFEQYFEPILDKLKKNMGMDVEDESLIKAKTKQRFYKTLRLKKLKLRARFGRLDKVIKSYAIEKLSRSSEFPNSRYMRVKAIVNRKKLNKTYFKFIRTEQARFFKTLYVSTDFHLSSVSWNDFGVEVEKDIRDVVSEHWKRWLQDNLKSIVRNVVIATDDDKIKLEERYRIPMKDVSSLKTQTSTKEEALGPHVMLEDRSTGSLWLKININIKGGETDPLLKLRECHFMGDFVLIDMSNNNLLSHYDFVKQSLNILDSSLKEDLSSRIAGLIYRQPLTLFSKFPKTLSGISNNKRFIKVTIKNSDSINDVYNLSKVFQEKGVRVDANFMISQFSKDTTIGLLSYRGEISKLSSILSKLNNMTISKGKQVKVTDMEHPFNFEIVTIPGSEK